MWALRCGLAVNFGIRAIVVQVNPNYSSSSDGEGLPLLANPLRGFARPLLRVGPQRPQ